MSSSNGLVEGAAVVLDENHTTRELFKGIIEPDCVYRIQEVNEIMDSGCFIRVNDFYFFGAQFRLATATEVNLMGRRSFQ